MKKKEIVDLINANRYIVKYNELYSLTRFGTIAKDKERWLPRIPEVQSEFDILTEELQEVLDNFNKAKDLIKTTKCDHSVRLEYYYTLGSSTHCIFCSEKADSDNCVSWENSINRNRHCAKLISKYQDDEDNTYVENGYTKEELYDIILKILEDKKDDEEVDLVQEFDKLHLKNCDINLQKFVPENFILIVGGTNKTEIDNTWLFSKSIDLGGKFLDSFYGLMNTKIMLLDNKENINSELESKAKKDYNIKIIKYETLEELNYNLKMYNKVPFKLIIDLSELYDYKIQDSSIVKERVDLQLDKMFPNSHIVRVKDLSKKSLEELTQFLKCYGQDEAIAYERNKYHYLENDEIESCDFNDVCKRVKKLLI